MASFKDATGLEWDLTLEIPKIIKICKKLKITSEIKVNYKKMEVAQFIECLPILCEEEMKERGIEVGEFLSKKHIPPSMMMDVVNCIMEAVNEAFPSATEIIGGSSSKDPLDLSKPSKEDGQSKTS